MVEIITQTLLGTNVTTTRNWKFDDALNAKTMLTSGMAGIDEKCLDMNVQDHWNVMENILINVIDSLAPLFIFSVKLKSNKNVVPRNVKQKMKRRKRLIKADLRSVSPYNSSEKKLLNSEIKSYFASVKIGNVRRTATGGSANLWKAVKLAKNLVTNELPSDLTLGGVPVAGCDVANSFAKHFNDKIKFNVSKTSINLNVIYNGKYKLLVKNRNFMQKSDVKKCLYELSSKKCEGFDRLPVCFINDSKDIIQDPLSSLFSKIYSTGQIPEQWKVSKIVPIFKKGSKNEIENYRPIANLCSTSKFFEKLILNQIHYLESTNKLDLTGKQQHGFKKNKSTATVGTLLQSMIARAADADCYVVMASLDLSMAFDLVNIELLVKRLRIMGMPNDLIKLIREWLVGRTFYVQVGDDTSALFDSDIGTIQGSVLGPILYALFVSPLFDLADITNFADDNFCLMWNRKLEALIVNLETKLEMITKWLRDSGLVVNESKTEICLFHRNDQPLIKVKT